MPAPFQCRLALTALALPGFLVLTPGVRAQTILADSAAEFSGVQGAHDWWHGYRNLTADQGALTRYDPVADFIPFPTDGTTTGHPGNAWNGTSYDFHSAPGVPVNPPWTQLGATGAHPNGTNQAETHWTTRRWTAPSSDLPSPALLQVDWHVAKANSSGNGVTALLFQNGILQGSTVLAGSDTTGLTKSSFLLVAAGDHLDLALSSVGADGDGNDASDSSHTSMVVSTAADSDRDGLPDRWEDQFFPGDLDRLFPGGDHDFDRVPDEVEFLHGTDPTRRDTDRDGLEDGWETNDGNFFSPTQTGSNPLATDTDHDGLTDGDEVLGTIRTNPNRADSDGDGFDDPEELLFASDPHDPGDTPLTFLVADSRRAFATHGGRDDPAGWRWGYRNVTADGGGTDYHPDRDFHPFPIDGSTVRSAQNFWNGTRYDWFNDPPNPVGDPHNPPWTSLDREDTHPNGRNREEEHWTVRRWTAGGLGAETPVRLLHHVRKTNPGGSGVTGAIHLNGVRQDGVALAGDDLLGTTRVLYLHLKDGDRVDQVLTSTGPTGDASDGSDGSANWFRIDTRIPAVPRQPDGKLFVPNNALDSDRDGLADFWEEQYVPGDPAALAGGLDYDQDGLTDADELVHHTDPTSPDTDHDGVLDREELAAGTGPCTPDTDGDGFTDGHELSTGYDPVNARDNPERPSPRHAADSRADFPLGELAPQGSVNGWSYGYYDTTRDGEPPANANFIPFPTTGNSTIPGDLNHWNGSRFDVFDAAGDPVNPPWTEIGRESGHPNGDNHGETQWATRRWTAGGSAFSAPGPLLVHFHLRKINPNGNGTSVVLLHNGQPVDSITVDGPDTVGQTRWHFLNASPGDHLALALTPRGPDRLDDGGADGSAFWMIVDTHITTRPRQPDGSLFVASSPASPRLLDAHYDPGLDALTLRWTPVPPGTNLQVQYSTTGLPPWTNLGSPRPGETDSATLAPLGLPESTYLFRLHAVAP